MREIEITCEVYDDIEKVKKELIFKKLKFIEKYIFKKQKT